MIIGHRIRLARQLRAKTATELARDLGVTGARVSQLEREGSSSDSLALRLAAVLDVPAEFFQRPDPVEVTADMVHMRHRARTRAGEKATLEAFCALFTDAVGALRERLGDTATIATPDVPSIAVEGVDAAAIEDVSRRVRRDWSLGDGPIPSMIGLLEERGVWVHRLPAPLRDVDACSVWVNGEAHVFLVPESRDAEGERFSIAHELGHLVMHEGVVTGDRATEGQANRFAGAFLLPAGVWLREAPRTTNPEAYVAAARRWRISVAALIRRSFDLGVLDADQYRSAMIRLSMGGHRRDERHLRGASIGEHPLRLSTLLSEAAAVGFTIEEIFGELAFPDDVLFAFLDGRPPNPGGRASHLRLVPS